MMHKLWSQSDQGQRSVDIDVPVEKQSSENKGRGQTLHYMRELFAALDDES